MSTRSTSTAAESLPLFVVAHRPALADLCRKFHVRRLELFGSATRGAFDPGRSDLDFLVELDALPAGAYAAAFLGFKQALEGLFGGPVDLIASSAIRNPYFRQSIDSSKALLYAA